MKKKKYIYIWKNLFIFYILILISNLTFNNSSCPNDEPFKNSGTCATSCSDTDIIVSKDCIPISTKEDDINQMFNIIFTYYTTNNISPFNKVIIEGEEINYIITKYSLENSNSGSSLIDLGNNCINKINEKISADFYIVLIKINIII